MSKPLLELLHVARKNIVVLMGSVFMWIILQQVL